MGATTPGRYTRKEGELPLPLWTPSPNRISTSNLEKFRQAVEVYIRRELPDYASLHAWSIGDIGDFWSFYAGYAGIAFFDEPRFITNGDPMPNTRWFGGATLNYAQALLYPPGVKGSDAAVVSVVEGGAEQVTTFADLRRQVAQVQVALRSEGVEIGDRVAAFATNTTETVVLFLACASLGAVFSSCSPDFGPESALARFGQIKPKLLFVSEAYFYGGHFFDTSRQCAVLAASLGVTKVISLPYLSETWETSSGAVAWSSWLESGECELEFLQLPFDHPLYILFSSGTTGLPKAIVHRAGGVLITHHKEHHLHNDISGGDRILYFSTCGWMMWNWLVSGLAQGATIFLYEGSPAYPDLGVLWRLAQRYQMTYFGVSARFLHGMAAQGVSPKSDVDLDDLRTIASTGSPLSPAGFRYVYEHIKADVHLASIAGGTDVVGCFMAGVPTLPVFAGQIQGPTLGVDLVALNNHGQVVIGEPGELVIRQPMPSMPLKFWDDPNGGKYRRAYFTDFAGLWQHGDLIELTTEQGIVVYGRSDATLNPGGVRIGTAEVYRPLESLPEIVEAAAVGRKVKDDEDIWLFVVLKQGVNLDSGLKERICHVIRVGASPRHVPKRFFQIDELPRTQSGKLMEIAVAQLVNGAEITNLSAVANPGALDHIADQIQKIY